ncbi:MAG: hypothetical protein ACHQF4_07055, partial [Sphingobacteriales bacterium]
ENLPVDEKKLAKQQADQEKATQKQLANQAKIDAANKKAAEPFNQLTQSYKDSQKETQNLAVSQGRLSQAYIDSNAKTKALKAEIDSINEGYGNSTGSVGKYEKALTRLGGILNSRALRLGVSFVIYDVVEKSVEALYKYIAALNVFNPIASAAQQAQNALDETFKNADFTKGVEGIEKLQSTIDLQKKGFASADDVINQYNETIGKSFGFVDTLTQAQQGFIDKSKDYIRSIELEAAANILLGQTSQFTADTLTKNQKLQDDIDEKNRDKAKFEATKTSDPAYYNQYKSSVFNSINNSIAGDRKAITENLQREQEYYDNSVKALDNFYSQRTDIVKKNGGKTGGDTDPIAGLHNDVANQALEKDKAIQQAIIDNEKASFNARISAAKKFGQDELDIVKNNTSLELEQTKAKGLQKDKIDNDASLKSLDIQNATAKKIQELEKARGEKAKAALNDRLKTVRDNEALILEDQSSTYQQRLDAIAKFQSESNAIINKGKKNGTLTGSDATALFTGIDKDAFSQRQDALNKYNDQLRKALEEKLKLTDDDGKATLAIAQQTSDRQLQILQDGRDRQAALLDKQYAKGKIDKKEYNDALLALDDEYNVDRLGQIAFQAQTVLEIKQAVLKNKIADVNNGSSNGGAIGDPLGFAGDEYSKATKIADLKANSGVPEAQQAVFKAGQDLSAGVSKQGKDVVDAAQDAKTKKAKDFADAIGYAQQAQQDASKIIQDQYQHEIDLLERKRQIIDNTAKEQIAQVNQSILSEKDKQNQINVINAQAANAQAQITAKENAIKTKEAEAQKAESIASIIENTAVAVSAQLAIPGAGIGLAVLVAALGAAQLATVIAQPIPKFEKGGITAGGGLIWGERGMELATLPSGERMLSPNSATYTTMPKGTVITPHLELMSALKPDRVNYSGGEQIGWKDVIQAIDRNGYREQKRNHTKVIINDNSGRNYRLGR